MADSHLREARLRRSPWPAVVIVLIVLALAATIVASVAAVKADQDIRTLLLNGKTASAIAARKTATEVHELLFLVQYVDNAQKNAGTATQAALGTLEQNIDLTIQRDVNQAAARIEHTFGG